MKATKAEFLRWLADKKKVRLTNCLLGPCDKPREVVKISGMNVQFRTERDTISHLSITANELILKTDYGYKIVLNHDPSRICAEYEEVV